MSTPSDTLTTASTSSAMQQLRRHLQSYRQDLSSFSSSSSAFKVLTSLSLAASTDSPAPKSLYILDSSFNPPTLAHLQIALSALKNDRHVSIKAPKKLILLLSTQNADKAPKPASFEQRLVMMEIMAQDLLLSLKTTSNNIPELSRDSTSQESSQEGDSVSIDIALTTHALFTQKALSISSSSSYPTGISQTHLVGYDTLIRILNPTYYHPRSLSSLSPFLSSHRLLVTYRPGATWDGKKEQDAYLEALGRGERAGEGGKREWVTEGRIVMDEASSRPEGAEVVSSTKVREAVKNGDEESLGRLVTNGVKEWIIGEGLYLDD